MNSVLIAFLALLASSLRTRASLQAEVLALRHQMRFFRPTRRAVCALGVPTACYGCGCRDGSQDGANVCASFNRQQ